MTEKAQGTRLLPFTYNQEAVYEQWIQINGQDRMDKRYGDYFHEVQPYQHHTGGNWDIGSSKLWIPAIWNLLLLFCCPPRGSASLQGTCNFSRMGAATIASINEWFCRCIESNPWNVRVYAVNYNILRIMSRNRAVWRYSN